MITLWHLGRGWACAQDHSLGIKQKGLHLTLPPPLRWSAFMRSPVHLEILPSSQFLKSSTVGTLPIHKVEPTWVPCLPPKDESKTHTSYVGSSCILPSFPLSSTAAPRAMGQRTTNGPPVGPCTLLPPEPTQLPLPCLVGSLGGTLVSFSLLTTATRGKVPPGHTRTENRRGQKTAGALDTHLQPEQVPPW